MDVVSKLGWFEPEMDSILDQEYYNMGEAVVSAPINF